MEKRYCDLKNLKNRKEKKIEILRGDLYMASLGKQLFFYSATARFSRKEREISFPSSWSLCLYPPFEHAVTPTLSVLSRAFCFSSTSSMVLTATTFNFKSAIAICSNPSRHDSLFTSTSPNLSKFFGSKSTKISNPQKLLPTMLLLSRRQLVLPSVSGLWDALTGGNSPREAVMAIRRGMLLFRQGDLLGSLEEFDKAIELDPRQKAYLWQRGLSLYYLDRFDEGAEQFRLDVAQNPNDTEESIWCFLCEAQSYGVDEARRRFLEVGQDPRPVMREAYNMFKDGGDPEKVVSAFSGRRENEYFYASLYAGLYYESQKKQDEAKRHIVAACQSPYGLRSDDYMAALAKVHCLCRNWGFT